MTGAHHADECMKSGMLFDGLRGRIGRMMDGICGQAGKARAVTYGGIVAACLALSGCAGLPAMSTPTPRDRPFTPDQVAQSDTNRLATLSMQANLDSLYVLLDKLYRRNPREWRKSGATSLEAAVERVRNAIQNGQSLPELGNRRDIQILSLALDEAYTGDRVAAVIYGLADMLITAHGGKTQFFLLDSMNATHVSNAARNIEIAVWMLTRRHDREGKPWLISNEISEQGYNVSFEREFGKMVGRLDLLVDMLNERYQRAGINYAHSLLFLQFLPVR
jgi:hypothetical protein